MMDKDNPALPSQIHFDFLRPCEYVGFIRYG
jgi:hypothetical protein